jgi:hypothetical protein
MKRNNMLTAAFTGGVVAVVALGLIWMRLTPPALAAPVAKPAAVTAASPLADLFAGKPFPLTVPTEQIDSTYHLVALVDAQGKPSLYATQGATTAAGGETYLVAYEVTLTDPKEGTPQPKPGTIGHVIYIDLHAIQAIGGIIPIHPAETIAPATP